MTEHRLHREHSLRKKDPSRTMNLIALEGAEWRANRTVLDELFLSVPRMNAFVPAMDSIGNVLFRRVTCLVSCNAYICSNTHPQNFHVLLPPSLALAGSHWVNGEQASTFKRREWWE
jgi:hypothetical protein